MGVAIIERLTYNSRFIFLIIVSGANLMTFAAVPMQEIGPIYFSALNSNDQTTNDKIFVPLATYESPLWPSTNRGAKVSRLSGGIKTTLIDDRMSRSVIFEATDAAQALSIVNSLRQHFPTLEKVVAESSRFAKLINFHNQVVANLIYLRFDISSGDAAGHNMVTKAAEHLMDYILKKYSSLSYVSISGNLCTDKKNSAINGILGRGKYVVAEITIPRAVCEQVLHTTPEKIVDLNIKKNLIGSLLAGGVRTANAHVANLLLGFYLATGQDAANIVEGSQAIVHAEVQNGDLYFTVTLPNLILGTIGNGKELDFVRHNLEKMGCLGVSQQSGYNARRLAQICAGTVLCGELSLMAALTNPGELMRSHISMERKATAETTV
jgi:hydroxymethylglutaryl-CoA reductase (NADPH)